MVALVISDKNGRFVTHGFTLPEEYVEKNRINYEASHRAKNHVNPGALGIAPGREKVF
jgi:hypothetical protein